MADRTIVCKVCGEELQVSEFAKTRSIVCRECGTAITVPLPAARKDTGLSFQSPEVSPPPLPASQQVSDTIKGTRAVSDREKAQIKMPKAVVGWITFLLLLLLMAGGILLCRERPNLDHFYLMGRWVVLGAVYIMLCADALGDGYLTGFLCMLLPPYTVYYGLTSADYYPLRGAFAAILVVVGLEVWLLPDDSLMTHANDIATAVIDFGQNNIRRAGDAPTF